MDLTEEPESFGEEDVPGTPSTETAVALIDENQWAVQIRQQKCMKDSEVQLKSRIDGFLELATTSEQKELKEARDQLWTLMRKATSRDDERNPTIVDGAEKPVSQRFKEGYESFLQSGYELSKHLDLFVGQAPEYVSLAWGAIKILMVVQISNEELKAGVHSNLKLLVGKFDLVDHLPEFMPQRNLITALAEAYGIFSKFLAKAVKYYSECRALRYLKAFTSPWKIRFQGIVDEIDVKFKYINEIATAQSHILVHKNLMVGQMNLVLSKHIAETDEKMWKVLQNVPEQLQKLEDKIRAITFENVGDVSQTSGGVQQRLEERFSEPSKHPSEIEAPFPKESVEIVLDDDELFDIFTDLRDLDLNQRQSQEADEQNSGSHKQKAKRRNMLQSEKVISWIESEISQLLWIDGNHILSRTDFLTSFATPVAIDAACNYESIVILKYFSSQGPKSRDTCSTLLQALIAQLLKQHPRLLGKEGDKISRSSLREAGRSVTKLWDIFNTSLSEIQVDRVYIIVDGFDELVPDQSDEYTILMSRLNALIDSNHRLVKVLLTVRLIPKLPMASEISNALSVPQRKWSLVPFKNDLPTMQHKFSEIHEGRCKEITFSEIMLLYPPMTVIFTREDGEYRAFVVYEISGMVETLPGRFDPLHLRVWSIDHNGKYFTKRYQDLAISQFSGRKAISELRYIPAGYVPNESEVRLQLMERGRRYWRVGEKPSLRSNIGAESGSVMIDQERRPLPDIPPQEFEDQLPFFADTTDLKPLTLILCPSTIAAYSLEKLKWITVKVENLQERYFSRRVLDLVAWDDEQKKFLLAAIKSFVPRFRPISAPNQLVDIVEGKGNGLVMLFHGPPSSGKSLAIEAVAEGFEFPLLVIDASRFSVTADMEKQLQEYLELGLRWKAIVHFKKADQFVDENSASNIGPGNIQYLFFRELERYSGIVALTTNRVGKINEEFISLFAIIFQFQALQREQQVRIWKTFLKQLSVSFTMRSAHPQNILTCNSPPDSYGDRLSKFLDYVEQDSDLKSLKPNGRQIRNLIRTALSLAQADERGFEVNDLRRAVKMSLKFLQYTYEISGDASYDPTRALRRDDYGDWNSGRRTGI